VYICDIMHASVVARLRSVDYCDVGETERDTSDRRCAMLVDPTH